MVLENVLRGVSTVLVFSLFGPLIAAVILSVLTAATLGAGPNEDAATWSSAIAFVVSFVSPFAFLLALMPAIAVGAFFAVMDFWEERSNIALAFFVGAVTAVVWLWSFFGKMPAGSPLYFQLNVVFASVGATVACWLMARSIADSW